MTCKHGRRIGFFSSCYKCQYDRMEEEKFRERAKIFARSKVRYSLRQLNAVERISGSLHGSWGGSFLGFSGSMNGQLEVVPKYYYYKEKDSEITFCSISAYWATIIEDEEEKPYVITYSEPSQWRWDFDMLQRSQDGINLYEFHVPKGAITNVIKLDFPLAAKQD